MVLYYFFNFHFYILLLPFQKIFFKQKQIPFLIIMIDYALYSLPGVGDGQGGLACCSPGVAKGQTRLSD